MQKENEQIQQFHTNIFFVIWTYHRKNFVDILSEKNCLIAKVLIFVKQESTTNFCLSCTPGFTIWYLKRKRNKWLIIWTQSWFWNYTFNCPCGMQVVLFVEISYYSLPFAIFSATNETKSHSKVLAKISLKYFILKFNATLRFHS